MPLCVLIACIGVYGAAVTAKYHERAEYHLTQARALTRALQSSGALADNRQLLKRARDDH